MMKNLFVIEAHRRNVPRPFEGHSYIVGVFYNKDEAIKVAKAEVAYRAGKYDCCLLPIINGVATTSPRNSVIEVSTEEAFKILNKIEYSVKYKRFFEEAY